jgi:hypothetical protein
MKPAPPVTRAVVTQLPFGPWSRGSVCCPTGWHERAARHPAVRGATLGGFPPASQKGDPVIAARKAFPWLRPAARSPAQRFSVFVDIPAGADAGLLKVPKGVVVVGDTLHTSRRPMADHATRAPTPLHREAARDAATSGFERQPVAFAAGSSGPSRVRMRAPTVKGLADLMSFSFDLVATAAKTHGGGRSSARRRTPATSSPGAALPGARRLPCAPQPGGRRQHPDPQAR